MTIIEKYYVNTLVKAMNRHLESFNFLLLIKKFSEVYNFFYQGFLSRLKFVNFNCRL